MDYGYFVAEFRSGFDRHAEVIQFFRSLHVNTFFVDSVAFGEELDRLKEKDKMYSPPSTVSVACGPDGFDASLNIKPEPITVCGEDTNQVFPATSATPDETDWRWLDQDLNTGEWDVHMPSPTVPSPASSEPTAKRSKHGDETRLHFQCQYPLCSASLHPRVTKLGAHLLVHSMVHVDAKYGMRYACKKPGCHVQKVSTDSATKYAHFNKVDHLSRDRLLDPTEIEFVPEAARLFSVCFPSVPLPKNVQVTLDVLGKTNGEIQEMYREAVKKNGKYDLQCMRCHIVIKSHSLSTGAAFSHAVTHVESRLGKRFKCSRCPVTKSKSSRNGLNHFDADHAPIDRIKEVAEREFVLAAVERFSVCFPEQKLPPLAQKTLEDIEAAMDKERVRVGEGPMKEQQPEVKAEVLWHL